MARRKAQSGARKGGRRRTPEAHQQTPKQVPWTVITVSVLLLLVLVGIGILFWSWFDAKPVQTTYQTALETLLAKNVSPIIAPDIATDFAGGNLTLRQLSKKYPGFEQDIRAADETIRNAEKDVLAIVNGETITRADLNRQSALLPESYRTALSDPQILDEMINEKLLLQDAAAKGIIASETEIQQGLDDLLTKGNLTEQQLEENIGSYGLTIQDLRTMLSRQIIINKLFNETVDNGIQITVGELKTLYDANKAQFQTGEKVTVRHILIAVGSSRDDATANKTAHEVLAAYKAGADFCTLVLNYTNDAGSKQTCGEYTFGRGFMVKPFEDAAFALSAGESAIVKTDFGYHVMLKMNDTPSRQIPFEEAAPLLEQQLQQQRRLEAYQAYISALRENATIVNNLVSASEAPTTEANATLEPLQSSTPAVENATGANTTEASTSTTVTIVLKNETNTTVTMLPAPSSPPATEQAPLPSTGQPDLSTFAQCLSEKGTTLYVASWDTISRQTLASFGDAAAKLSVVDCASAENADACSAVQAYPTWKVNGKLFLGPLSFNELASRTGCVSH